MQSLHLGLGRSLGRFSVVLVSRTCLTSLSGSFWIHGRTMAVVISEFREVVRYSGLCKFHSGALCCEVSRQGRKEGAPNHRGVLKSPNDVARFFFNTVAYIYSQKTLGLNMGTPNLFFVPRAVWPRYAPVTPWTLRKNPISAACTWVNIISVISQDSWPQVRIGTTTDLKTESFSVFENSRFVTTER